MDTTNTEELSFEITGLGDESFLADTLGLGDGEKNKVTLTAENPCHTFTNPFNTSLFLDKVNCTLSDILQVELDANNLKIGMRPGADVLDKFGWTYFGLTFYHGDGHVDYNHPFKDTALMLTAGSKDTTMDDSERRVHHQRLVKYTETLTDRNDPTVMNVTVLKRAMLQDDELAVYQNKVRLRLGWKSGNDQATILFSETRDLSAPGSYVNLDVWIQELYATFQSLLLPSTSGRHTVDLSDLLMVMDRESIHHAHFRLKALVTTPGPKINYLELTINPHMCVMLGLLPSTTRIEEPEHLASKTVALVGNANLSEANKAIVPAVPMPEMGEPVKVTLAKTTTNTYTAPNRLNMNLGISSMYIYMPDIVERSNIGQSSLAHLATVPIHGKPNERVHHTIINPVGRKLVQDKVEEIPVEILDHKGDRIRFTSSINAVALECKIQSYDRIK